MYIIFHDLLKPSDFQDHPKQQLFHLSEVRQKHSLLAPPVAHFAIDFEPLHNLPQHLLVPRQPQVHHRSTAQKPVGWRLAWPFVPQLSRCFHPVDLHFLPTHWDPKTGPRQKSVAENLSRTPFAQSFEVQRWSVSVKATLQHFVRWVKQSSKSRVHRNQSSQLCHPWAHC